MAPSFDIVIGYHARDIKFVEKVAAKLEKSDMTVWYKRNQDAEKQTCEAIMGCKIYLPVMSEDSAVDKCIQEQLSLAYISNSAIYPLAQTRFRFISPKLSGGAKLMLAKINWCFVFNPEEFDSKLEALVASMKKDLESARPGPASSTLTEAAFCHGLSLPHKPMDDSEVATDTKPSDQGSNIRFWDRHFHSREQVPWTEFRDKFLQDYGKKIDTELPDVEEDKLKFIINLIFKDIFDMNKTITKKMYDEFCATDEPDAFFNRTQEYFLAYLSLREVLGMDSSLRISTIQNLGQFSFPAIVSGLSDMLKDDDPNIRAVAAIALAHAGNTWKNKQDTVDHLIGIIEDEDRLVRESACLSLGYLRSVRAVSYVVDRWRNDPISTVREAAELALSKMDAIEAQRCMKVTQVLSSEMSALKPKAA